jgi:NAD(P)-dependent dehydrogenase (short-subunit alcohol dehydrogenase family)
VRKAAEEFTRNEERLDMLWNNAGVMLPPAGSVTEQGYELQLGVNCLAALLFTRLLTPVMKRTAERAEKDSVRVVWVSSSAAELFSPTGGGLNLDNLDYHMPVSETVKYAISKSGMVLLSHEYAELHRGDGIVSVVRPSLELLNASS